MLIGFIFRVKLLKKSSESSKQDDYYLVLLEAVIQRFSVKKVFLEISQNSQEKSCARPQACNFIKKEFCEISENTFLHRTPLVAASVLYWKFNTEVVSSEFFEEICHLIIDQKAKG